MVALPEGFKIMMLSAFWIGRVAMILAIFGGIAAAAGDATALPSKTDIESCLQRYLGLPSEFHIKSTERVSLSALDIPFLASSLKNDVGLKVILAPAKLPWKELPGHPPENQPMPDRSITVYTDAEAKRVYFVSSWLASEGPLKKERIPSTKAEMELRQLGEKYESFPVDGPKITLLEALEIMRQAGPAYPPRAAEIDAMYVNFRGQHYGAFPAWIVETRGRVRKPFSKQMLSGDLLRGDVNLKDTFLRSIVDASHRKWINGAFHTLYK